MNPKMAPPLRHLRYLSSTASNKTSSISISRAKSELRTEYDPDRALNIYSSVSKKYSSPVSSRYALDLTVRRLAKSRRFSDIQSLLDSHMSDPKIKEEPFLSSIIRSYGRAGMFDHALKTFHQMDQFGTPRSAVSFNALLFACTQSKLFDHVPVLFADIASRYGVLPNKISYGILVKSYCESGKPDEAVETLKEMEDKGVEVTAVTFTTILDSLYKKGEVEEAERLWGEMVEKGCELDTTAYNVKLMQAQGEGPEKVKRLIDEMENMGLKPDTISYNYLMTSYCKNGMMEEAMKVYEGLVEKGCNPNATTFRTLIFYLCRSGELEKGYNVFQQSLRVNKIPDFNTMKHLVEGLVKEKKLSEAKGIIQTMKMKFPPSFLNAWKKVEENLRLVPANDALASKGEIEEVLQATA